MPTAARDPDSDRQESRQHLVLVAGAGRSGTSTLAGILQRLGLVVPTPEVEPDETNPRGFSESRWVVDFHDDLLAHANVQVSDARPLAWSRTAQFAERPGAPAKLGRWLRRQLATEDDLLIKDPRLSWFLPLWTTVARKQGVEPSFVTMLRPPAEVVGSKRTYYNSLLQDGHGVAAWVNMLLNTERATRGSARTFVRYHDLLADWESVVEGILTDLDLDRSVSDDVRKQISGFIDPGLRRVDLTWEDLDLPGRLESLARRTWEALDQLPGAGQESAELLAELDGLHEDYAAYYLEAEVVSRSTVIAARRALRQQPHEPDPREVSGRTAARALAYRSASRSPRWLRQLVPSGVRARMRNRMAGGGEAT
jgi:hypothetical protein